MKSSCRFVRPRTLAILALLAHSTLPVMAGDFDFDIATAQSLSPPVGTVIDSSNLENSIQLLDPEFAELVREGWLSITVGEPVSFDPHPNYIAATEAHAGETTLGDAPGVLNGYVGGRPFPGELSQDDPRAGEKLVWNMRYGYAGDGGEIPEMYWQYRDMRAQKIERELEFEAAAMRFMYRHVVDPVPELPDNTYRVYNALTLTALEPGDVANTKLLIFYNSDDTAEEQGWMYVPLLRRVRRVATTMRTDSFLGSDIMIEDFLGYTGRIMDMEWKYGGERWILLPMYRHDQIPHAERKARRHDYHFVDFGGHSGCFPNVTWQPRRVLVLEGTTKRSDHPLSKRLIYIDAQTMFPVFGKVYDRGGVLWKFLMGGLAHPDYHLPENQGTGVPLLDTSSVVDVQNMHCTTLQMVTLANLPNMKQKDFEPSALNVGAR
ncbi:MAG: DUF1329 domain-containing protein [Gammaproteobacteria bacterium]|nr:DUF1329 domain-containing protein [Gammaproteobacteria bacterium]MCP5198545.1 DUF1329 domain-containing protein [Gammaproteobacteria bacterium]